ncbi:MAG: hypothetical protein HBSAPP02_20520 [Phycisphaerae bacterium]|nr:MAG: hypothetical protein HRU71_05190 [Planctomycetia bacterium]RIK69965.1 MAG: hypothetical protein DCC66_07060 [Planctomycetota bacterium]GJQ27020.1 MAG: hypothetical protein HBSAPP02_20520 [Phycisphaerae bacterium]
MPNSKSIQDAVHVIRQVVETNREEITRTLTMIKRRTLDSHFLIRSVESGYSYKWGENRQRTEEALIQDGLAGLAYLVEQEFPSLAGYRKNFAGDFSFWAILAKHGFVSIASIGSILDDTSILHSPLKMQSYRKWQMPAFLDELANGKGGHLGRAFSEAMQDVEKYGCHLPRYRGKFYYGILRNANLLKNKYDGSFERYLRAKLSAGCPDQVAWEDIGRARPEDWERIRPNPWKDLFGVGPDIFFYILRDIDFGIKQRDFVKLDNRNARFLDAYDLWSLGYSSRCQTNENARCILLALNNEIRRHVPNWELSISELNFAIYLAGI